MTVWSTAAFGLFTLITVFGNERAAVDRASTAYWHRTGSRRALCRRPHIRVQSQTDTRNVCFINLRRLFPRIYCRGLLLWRDDSTLFGWTAPLWVCSLGPIILTLLLIPSLA